MLSFIQYIGRVFYENLQAMNILLVLDKFKGSLSASAVIDAIRKGISEFDPSIKIYHIIASDVGDEFLNAIGENLKTNLIEVKSVNPFGKKII